MIYDIIKWVINMKKVLLIDGNNLIFRCYYATAYRGVIMRNSKGFPTNALYGFINMMKKIINEENADYVMVAFDKGKTFRHKKYDFYKADRSKTPDELKEQMPKAKELLEAMGITYLEVDNYEADDIIGTYSKILAKEADISIRIISSDKDLLQLINDKVDVKLLKQNDYIIMDNQEFINTYKINPINMIDLKALMGDPSDNIPGVKGIGEKTAISLLEEYKTLDNLYNNIDNIKGKTKEKLEVSKEVAYISYELATIYNDIELDINLENLKIHDENHHKFIDMLKEFEFLSLIKKYDTKEVKEVRKLLKKDISEFSNKDFSFYIETTGEIYSKSTILGISLFDGEYNYFIKEEDINKYSHIFESNLNKSTYDAKKAHVLLNKYNIIINNLNFDLMIGANILNYSVKDDIAYLAQSLNYDISFYEDDYGTIKRPKEKTLLEIEDICNHKVNFIYNIKSIINDELIKNEQLKLFTDIEMPLVEVLASMEIEGIKVDQKSLDNLAKELEDKLSILEKEIYTLANHEFNIMSPTQLAVILFEELNIPYPKKVKNNKYSTSKDILDKVKDDHIIINKVLEYRTLSKLYTNYAVGLKNEVRSDGRIHTTYTQTLTRTGRLSSLEPNLQNIPIRSEYSSLIRKAFIPDDNSLLFASDYSQVELRIFAHMSKASNLLEAFNNNIDIHTKTAADIFHINIEDVTKEQRRCAKAVNFGILYGISSYGLSEDLNIDIASAKKFIDNYLETYPGIKDFMDNEIKVAKNQGYVKTLFNHKRNIEDINSTNFMIRSAAERMALNTPIQGSAADILKLAMINIYKEFKKRNLKSKILLQVHDELVFNCLKEEKEEVEKIVIETMENTVNLDVILKVEASFGENWYQTK